MKAGKGLGKGLGALLGDDALQKDEKRVLSLRLSQIEPNKNQPRKEFNDHTLNELAQSIKENGILQPIAVRELSSGQYQIIAGERRWRASHIAGLLEIPVIVHQVDDQKTMQLALIENLQREDLNPVEEAFGYRSLIDEFGLTQEEAAVKVGISRPAMTNSMRLLNLPDPVLKMLITSQLTSGHARALLHISDKKQLLDAAKKVSGEKLNVRQTEQMAAAIQKNAGRLSKKSYGGVKINYTESIEKSLQAGLGRKVSIIPGRRKGKIELEYYDVEDLEKLVKQLEGIFEGESK